MEAQEKYLWIDEFLDSAERTYGFMDLKTMQPTSWRHFQPLIAKEWLAWFERIKIAQEKQKVSFDALGKSIPSSNAREGLTYLFEDLKSAHLPKEKRLALAQFMHNINKTQLTGDYFGLQETNKKHSEKEVEGILEKPFQKGTPEAAREHGKLYTAAYNLAAALYLDFYLAFSVENYGPYDIGNNRILVVKELREMRPKEIWPNRDTVARTVVLYSIYENVGFSIDLIGCHSQYTGDTIHGLKQWRMEVDGKEITDVADIKKTMLSVGKNAITQWKELTALSEQDLIEKAVWVRCYLYKGACDLVGIDWKPTPELLQATKGKTLRQGWEQWHHPTDETEYKAYWRKVFDPRIDFYH